MAIFLSGFFASLGLIAAIGAQNAFVLRQGLKREHLGIVVFICAASDTLLIALGVAGFGAAVQALPWLTPVMLWGGVGFLTVYGALRFRAALRGGAALAAAASTPASRGKVVATVLAFTWLNPHVYLDTLALLGALSTQHAPHEWVFGAGAMTGSVAFFTALGFGARLLAPVLARPRAWVVLEVLIGLVMWAIAASLVIKALSLGGT